MKLRLIFSSIFLLCTISVFSQDGVDNVDDAFTQARELGFNGERRAAIDLAQRILIKAPTYADVRNFLGRLYTWEGQYDSARIQFLIVLKDEPDNEDAYLALMDCELYDDNPAQAYAYSLNAFKSILNPSEEIYYRKAKALYDSTQYKESLAECDTMIEKFPDFQKAKDLRENNLLALRVNKVTASWDYDDFNKRFGPWYLGYLAYARRTEAFGTVVGRLNYASRFDTSGYQAEVDMYPIIIPGTYSYVNFGYSNFALFPTYRVGYSLYKNLPRSYEGEIGFRWLKFDNSVWIYTASVGKYIGRYWFNVRTFVIPQDNKQISLSFLSTTRYYFGDRDNYFGVLLGYGLAPDEKISGQDPAKIQNIISSNPFPSSRIALDYSQTFYNKFFFNIFGGVRYTEISDALFVTNYNIGASLGMSFR